MRGVCKISILVTNILVRYILCMDTTRKQLQKYIEHHFPHESADQRDEMVSDILTISRFILDEFADSKSSSKHLTNSNRSDTVKRQH